MFYKKPDRRSYIDRNFRNIYILIGKKIIVGLLERRVKEKDNRKKLILKSARALFFKKGFNNVTVDAIAKSSELGKGSIYLYFNSKEEIYTQILLNDIDNFNQHVSVLFDEKKSVGDLLFEFSCIYVDFFLNEPELFRILMTYMLHPTKINLTEELNSQILTSNYRSIDVIGKIFQKAASKEFSADINIKQNQNAIWGLLNGIISLYIFSGAQEKRRERIHSTIKLALEIFIKGLKQA